MPSIGQILQIKAGAFKGYTAKIVAIHSLLTVELEIFSRKTIAQLPYQDFGLEYTPLYQPFETLLQQFDRLYQIKAPLRYARLRKGISKEKILSNFNLRNISIPDDFIKLLQWKNGMVHDLNGWKNEFEEDGWYEYVPLDCSNCLMDIEDIVSTMKEWQTIAANAKKQNYPCLWQEGFIPFLTNFHDNLTVIDTVGSLGGKPGQIIYFEEGIANNAVMSENLNKWLETQIQLLNNDQYFNLDFEKYDAIQKQVNGYYTSRIF